MSRSPPRPSSSGPRGESHKPWAGLKRTSSGTQVRSGPHPGSGRCGTMCHFAQFYCKWNNRTNGTCDCHSRKGEGDRVYRCQALQNVNTSELLITKCPEDGKKTNQNTKNKKQKLTPPSVWLACGTFLG